MFFRRWLGAGMILGFASTAAAGEPALSPAALMAHVQVLTDPKLQGRAAGSAGEAAAAGYVAMQLRDMGLEPRYQFFPIGFGQSANVYAHLQGQRDDEIVIVGAHVDHLGMRNRQLHPGASDNASGVATLLGLTRVLAAERARLSRSVMVVFFGAEEIGLLGSKALVRDPPRPLGRVVAMVNLDSIGRPLGDQAGLGVLAALLGIDREHGTGLLGTRHRPGLRALADAAFADGGGELLAAEDLPDIIGDEVAKQSRGRGDSESFAAVGVPTLFFSEGESSDYHQPGDTADKLHPDLLARRAEAVLRLVRALSAAPLDRFAPHAEVPAKRKPPAGLYFPVGLSTGASLGNGAGFYLGGETSAVYLSRSLFWLGGYADAKRDFGGGAWRVSAGPEIGYGVAGVDGGYLVEYAGGKQRQGFAGRAVVGVSAVSLACRVGALGSDLFAEIGLLLKWPFAIVVR